MDGALVLDKPAGISSARAVAAVKRLLPGKTKIGHAGTLDPFATGVLLLLVGKATRLCESLMDLQKEYEATIQFGATSTTDDREGQVVAVPGAGAVSKEHVADALSSFTGTILQRPPAFSALKVGGQRAYALARRGE